MVMPLGGDRKVAVFSFVGELNARDIVGEGGIVRSLSKTEDEKNQHGARFNMFSRASPIGVVTIKHETSFPIRGDGACCSRQKISIVT
jgi:hypothetical protein